MKLLFKFVFLLVVLVIALGVAAFIFVDKIAKTAIERGGTHALGVDTTVAVADVGLIGGTFDMEAFEVANPEGFDAPHFLRLDEGGVALSIRSLLSDTVEMSTLRLNGLDVHLQRGRSGANYDAILDHLKQFESEPTEDGKRFMIDEVVIENVVVHVDMLRAGGSLTGPIDLPIDELRLENVGTEGNKGLLLAEVVGVIVKAVLVAVIEKGGDVLPGRLIRDLTGDLAGLESLADMGIGLVSQLGDVSGLLENAGEVLEDVREGLGDNLGDAIDTLREGGNPLENLPGGGGGGSGDGG